MRELELTVIGDRVAVDVTPATQTASGLFIPSHAKNEAEQGRILSCGPDVGSAMLTPGTQVVFGRFAGTVFKLGNKQIKIVREEDIMLILPSDAMEDSDGKLHFA